MGRCAVCAGVAVSDACVCFHTSIHDRDDRQFDHCADLAAMTGRRRGGERGLQNAGVGGLLRRAAGGGGGGCKSVLGNWLTAKLSLPPVRPSAAKTKHACKYKHRANKEKEEENQRPYTITSNGQQARPPRPPPPCFFLNPLLTNPAPLDPATTPTIHSDPVSPSIDRLRFAFSQSPLSPCPCGPLLRPQRPLGRRPRSANKRKYLARTRTRATDR